MSTLSAGLTPLKCRHQHGDATLTLERGWRPASTWLRNGRKVSAQWVCSDCQVVICASCLVSVVLDKARLRIDWLKLRTTPQTEISRFRTSTRTLSPKVLAEPVDSWTASKDDFSNGGRGMLDHYAGHLTVLQSVRSDRAMSVVSHVEDTSRHSQ